jgi:YD repeat-containing protein
LKHSQYEYDPTGNLLVRRDCSLDRPTEWQFDYDGKDRLIRLTDESGAVTRLFYDRNDRIAKAVRPQQYDAAQDDGAGFCYAYDCRDRVTRITGLKGTVLQEQAYDSFGNIRSQMDGQSVYTEYEHNLSGLTDRTGRTSGILLEVKR